MAAIVTILFLNALAEWRSLVGGTIIGIDSANFFLPMYSFLGESLRSLRVPMWNPYIFSGAPFAADPQSGWMYLPAMTFFTIFPFQLAAKFFMFFHLALAGLSAYALARILRITPMGALLAAVIYQLNGFIFLRNACCYSYLGIVCWLPLMIIGIEMALRTRVAIRKAFWWGIAGLSLGQALSTWLGQGSYYAIIVAVSYIAYSSLMKCSFSYKVAIFVLVKALARSILFLVLGFGLAAAGVLPRVEFVFLSDLSGGYTSQHATGHGWEIYNWLSIILPSNGYYVGAAAIFLVCLSLFFTRRHHANLYWTLLSVSALTLTLEEPTFLHIFLYNVLPGFENLHPHNPERIMMVFYLGISMLSGATLSKLKEKKNLFTVVLVIVIIIFLSVHYSSLSEFPLALLFSFVLFVCLCMCYGLVTRRHYIFSLILIFFITADLIIVGQRFIDYRLGLDAGSTLLRKVDLDNYYLPRGAGNFLMQRYRNDNFRFFGYDLMGLWSDVPYRHKFAEIASSDLIVNNRAVKIGIQDIQGYNPVYLKSYKSYIYALNQGEQEYRSLYVFPKGLESPLIDLLNVRYVVIPSVTPADREDIKFLEEEYNIVYKDHSVRVLERLNTMPRTWIVHKARKVNAQEGLSLLTSNAIDPQETVLLEEDPPSFTSTENIYSDIAKISKYENDEIEVITHTSYPGILVLSEIYYPAWRAFIDGKQTHIYKANQILRAVEIPPGKHTVEFRYRSKSLRAGLMISSLFHITLLFLFAINICDYNKNRHISH